MNSMIHGHKSAAVRINNKKPVIFCDFDGTITISDNIISVMRHFNPAGWEDILSEVISAKISIKQGVGQLFALFPSSARTDILNYVLRNTEVRKGFMELLNYCKEQNILFLVTSGGIDFFVYPILSPYPITTEHIFCNESDFSGETIQILWPHPCDSLCHNDCGMCKVRVIRNYPDNQYYRILIGDSLTDFEGAKLADMVFARSHLVDRCEELGIAYSPYEDFLTVIEDIDKKVVSSP
ncbi:MAG TPA: 2-hydroxy-3-keto-5-methylthiopentenyl-1-phosphate phosphatase [Bacilli bacterium]